LGVEALAAPSLTKRLFGPEGSGRGWPEKRRIRPWLAGKKIRPDKTKKIRPWLATTGPRPSSPGEVTRIPFHLPSEASGGVGPPIQPTGVVEAVRTHVNPRSRTQCVTAALIAEPQDTRLGCGQPLRARPAPRPMTHPHPPGALWEARASVSSGPGCKRPRVLRFECP